MSGSVQAALLGIVQGLTEFLPVSSTAHLLIGARLIGFEDPGSAFTEMIQLGSILAIMWLYRAKLVLVATGLPRSAEARRFAALVLAGFAPAVLAGLLVADFVESVLHQSVSVIAWAFIVGGVVMLGLEWLRPVPVTDSVEKASIRQAIGVGLFQLLALVPGVSRSGATIVGGMLVGLDRGTAAEYSFFLAMPTLVAAFVRGFFEVREQVSGARALEIVVGLAAAFAASALVVKPFLNAVRRFGFAPFAWYRILAGVAILAAHARGLL